LSARFWTWATGRVALGVSAPPPDAETGRASAGARRAAPTHWRHAAAGYGRYAGDQLVEWLCDYGESVPA
jgi:hypothetical protein